MSHALVEPGMAVFDCLLDTSGNVSHRERAKVRFIFGVPVDTVLIALTDVERPSQKLMVPVPGFGSWST